MAAFQSAAKSYKVALRYLKQGGAHAGERATVCCYANKELGVVWAAKLHRQKQSALQLQLLLLRQRWITFALDSSRMCVSACVWVAGCLTSMSDANGRRSRRCVRNL